MKFVILFLFLIVIGSLGNFYLLWHYIYLYFSGCRSRPIDFILINLIVANLLFIVSRGIPETMAALGMEDFLSDVGCKLTFYVQVVGRDVSFSTTCTLSVLQAITLNPRNSKWTELKIKSLKFIRYCPIIFWVFHMLINFRVPMLVSDKRNNANRTNTIDYQYCSAVISSADISSVLLAIKLSYDVFCLELMVWSSGSMVFILSRHKQRMQHIHARNSSSRSTAETRASQSILVLVCAFVCFYALSSIITAWFSAYDRAASWLGKTSALIYAGFPTVSPLILVTREECACRPIWKKQTHI